MTTQTFAGVRAIFREQGLQRHSAENGEEAISEWRKHAPELVLLDYRLPGNFDGLEVLRQIDRKPAPILK